MLVVKGRAGSEHLLCEENGISCSHFSLSKELPYVNKKLILPPERRRQLPVYPCSLLAELWNRAGQMVKAWLGSILMKDKYTGLVGDIAESVPVFLISLYCSLFLCQISAPKSLVEQPGFCQCSAREAIALTAWNWVLVMVLDVFSYSNHWKKDRSALPTCLSEQVLSPPALLLQLPLLPVSPLLPPSLRNKHN